MLKNVEGYNITKMLKYRQSVKVRPFLSAKTRCMSDHVKPTLRDENPDHVIIHVGTNSLVSDQTAIQMCHPIINLAASIRAQNIPVLISGIVPRNDEEELSDKAMLVNEYLSNISQIQVLNLYRMIIYGRNII